MLLNPSSDLGGWYTFGLKLEMNLAEVSIYSKVICLTHNDAYGVHLSVQLRETKKVVGGVTKVNLGGTKLIQI